MVSRQITVRGIPMRWEEWGEGERGVPVVMIHGIPTSATLWRHVGPRLHGVRALAWDMVGYGESIPEGRDRDVSVAQQAKYLVGWLQELGIERAILVGHDLGGGVAQIAAVRNPGLCAGLFLTNSVGYDSWPIPAVRAMRAMGPALAAMPDRWFEGVFKRLVMSGHDDRKHAEESARVHWEPYARHGGAAALVRQMRFLDPADTMRIAEGLGDLNVPARVVWGEADPAQTIQYGERLAWDLGTTVQRIRGGLHFTPEDHAETLASAIDDLAQEVEASAPRPSRKKAAAAGTAGSSGRQRSSGPS